MVSLFSTGKFCYTRRELMDQLDEPTNNFWGSQIAAMKLNMDGIFDYKVTTTKTCFQ